MTDIKSTLRGAEERTQMATTFLEEQLNRIRAGCTNVATLDGMMVDSCGFMVPLNQIIDISVSSAHTITIKPWDRKAIRDIGKAIMDSDVGITPEDNGEIIRLGIPQPTEERRHDLVKQYSKVGGKSGIEVRNVRSEVRDELEKAIKDGLSEDTRKDTEDELQKIHDKFIKQVDNLLEDRTKEIMTV